MTTTDERPFCLCLDMVQISPSTKECPRCGYTLVLMDDLVNGKEPE